MMTLVHFRFLAAIEIVYADPGVRGRTNDEPVAIDWMKGGG